MQKIALHRTMVKAKLNFAPCEGIQNPENFCLWDRESQVLKFGIQFKKSGIKQRLQSRIQVPLTRSGIKYLESGIHGVKSRIQDSLGFPCMGRLIHL